MAYGRDQLYLQAILTAVQALTGDSQKVFAHERHGDWIYTRGGSGDSSTRAATAAGGIVQS